MWMQRFLVVLTLLAVCTAAQANEGYRFLELNGRQVRWGTPGNGASLTYRVATEQDDVSGAVNCPATTGLKSLLAHSHLSRIQFDGELKGAFAMWSEVANIRFVHAAAGTTADLVVGAEGSPDGIAYSDVTPTPNSNRPRSGIVCLNPAALWTAGADLPGKTYRLRYVLAHEVGHILGLDHPSPSGELMSFEYNPSLTALQPGDIAGIVALYGLPERPTLAFNPPLQLLSPRQK